MFKYSSAEEEYLSRIARESNDVLNKILPPERESMKLGDLFCLITACEEVLASYLEKKKQQKKIEKMLDMTRHHYRNSHLKDILAAAVLIGETAIAANRKITLVFSRDKDHYTQLLYHDFNEKIKAYRKRHKKIKGRLENIAAFENTCFLLYNHSTEKFVLMSAKKSLELHELEFYTADAEKGKKMLQRYFS